MPFERVADGIALGVPQPHGSVTTATEDAVAVGAKGDGVDPILMPDERVTDGIALAVPQPQCSIPAATEDAAAVGAKGDGVDPTPMPDERVADGIALAVPQSHRSVITATEDAAAVGAKGDRPDPTPMPLESVAFPRISNCIAQTRLHLGENLVRSKEGRSTLVRYLNCPHQGFCGFDGEQQPNAGGIFAQGCQGGLPSRV